MIQPFFLTADQHSVDEGEGGLSCRSTTNFSTVLSMIAVPDPYETKPPITISGFFITERGRVGVGER